MSYILFEIVLSESQNMFQYKKISLNAVSEINIIHPITAIAISDKEILMLFID